MNRAAVIIAVKKAGALPELQAAIAGAQRFETWARRENFDPVVLISDEQGPVTAKAIKDAIKTLVNSDSVEQLFVYFAGHGVNLHYGEYWLLSDAPEDTQEAVNVAGSVHLAKRCGIPHVVLISDACRTAPEGIQAQAIRGSEIFPNQPRGGPQKAVDVFYASLLGEPALEIQDKSASALRYDSVFTAELMAALQGERQTILSPSPDSKKIFLRPQPLKRHLISEVPKLVAQRLGDQSEYTQTPDAEILSDEFAFIQSFDAADPRLRTGVTAPPSRPRSVRSGPRGIKPPAPPVPPGRTSSPAQDVLNTGAVGGQSVTVALRESGSIAQRAVVESVPMTARPDTALMPCGFIVWGAQIASVSTSDESTVQLLDGAASVQPKNKAGASALLELTDGRAVLLPVIPDFTGSLTFQDGELVDVTYESSVGWRKDGYRFQRDELTMLRGLVASAVHRGVFRLERADAPKLTDRIRSLKGLDPTLALYAAYSYHRMGTPQLIQEMEDYLLGDIGVTLFDIAMLADRDSRGGRPVPVPFAPMLAQGWSLLSAFGEETPLLRDLRGSVTSRTLWTVFDKSAVVRLRQALTE